MKLNRLVNSLNTSEKRFISKRLSKENKGSKISILFRSLILDKEQEIKNANAYYVRRKLLKDEIFKQLRLYHANSSDIHKIRNTLFDIEILYDKGLYSACLKLINKSLSICEKNEYFELELSLLDKERQILQSNQKLESLKEDINTNFQRTDEVYSKLRNLNLHQKRYYEVVIFFRKTGSTRSASETKKIEEIFNYYNDEEIKEFYSFSAKKYFFLCNTFYYFAINEYSKSYENAKQHLNTLKYFQKQSDSRAEDFLSLALMNVITCEVELKRYTKALESLKELRALNYASERIFAIVTLHSYLIEIEIDLKMGAFSKMYYFHQEIQQSLKKHGNFFSKEYKLLLQYKMGYLCLGANKPQLALKWINRVINERDENIREDFYCYALLLNLILHYELSNYTVMESFALSTHRYLYKKERNYKIENIFLKYIRNQLLNYTDSKNLKKSFEELKILIEQLPEKDKEIALENFDFLSWLESKIQNRSFAEIVKEKYNENNV